VRHECQIINSSDQAFSFDRIIQFLGTSWTTLIELLLRSDHVVKILCKMLRFKFQCTHEKWNHCRLIEKLDVIIVSYVPDRRKIAYEISGNH